jgi:hypothetical protein
MCGKLHHRQLEIGLPFSCSIRDVVPSSCDTPAFEEFRASTYLDVMRREFPFSEGDDSILPGYSSIRPGKSE